MFHEMKAEGEEKKKGMTGRKGEQEETITMAKD